MNVEQLDHEIEYKITKYNELEREMYGIRKSENVEYTIKNKWSW